MSIVTSRDKTNSFPPVTADGMDIYQYDLEWLQTSKKSTK